MIRRRRSNCFGTRLSTVRHCNNTNSSLNINEILKICVDSSVIDNINIGKVIGSGTFGTVREGTLSFANSTDIIECAIKVIHFEINDINNFFMEIDISTRLGIDGIGPKIYYSFYESYSDVKNIGYIIMEKMVGDCNSLIKQNIYDISFIINEIINKYYSLIFDYNIYCFDIKPQNCLYNVENNNLIIRLSDFDGQFCKLNEDDFFVNEFGSLDAYKNACFLSGVLTLLVNVNFNKYYNFTINNNKIVNALQYTEYFIELLDKPSNDEVLPLYHYSKASKEVLIELINFYLYPENSVDIIYYDNFNVKEPLINILKNENLSVHNILTKKKDNKLTNVFAEGIYDGFPANIIKITCYSDINEIMIYMERLLKVSNGRIGPYVHKIICIKDIKHNEDCCMFYVIMNKEEYLNDLFKTSTNTIELNNIVSSVINKLYEEIFDFGMFCSNIKPQNVCYKKFLDKYKITFTNFENQYFFKYNADKKNNIVKIINNNITMNNIKSSINLKEMYNYLCLLTGTLTFLSILKKMIPSYDYDFSNVKIQKSLDYIQYLIPFITKFKDDESFLLIKYNVNQTHEIFDFLQKNFPNLPLNVPKNIVSALSALSSSSSSSIYKQPKFKSVLAMSAKKI